MRRPNLETEIWHGARSEGNWKEFRLGYHEIGGAVCEACWKALLQLSTDNGIDY